MRKTGVNMERVICTLVGYRSSRQDAVTMATDCQPGEGSSAVWPTTLRM